ncbi:MAG TPA: ribonuclease domain-containing protein [Rhodanobacteraceae bacterium]|jgi:guanyl-specific ribonuclease Sa|nr:ribonuclease domain-containing protein [Rhodanobacteraceae bacterium]
MQRNWKTLLPLLILAVVVGYLYMQRNRPLTAPPAPPTASAGVAPQAPAALPSFLPPEAVHTLALIASNGPFPHRQDGTVFGNYEHLLPSEPRGYYHEYTVATPGAHDRGARRIVAGGNPPVVYYYTDDHYRSFRKFTVPQ